jgi:aspartyl-tRNA synthetase
LRYGLELVDIGDIVARAPSACLPRTWPKATRVKAICVPAAATYSRKQLTELEDLAKTAGAKALAWLAIHPETGEIRGPIAKFFTVDQLIAMTERLTPSPGDLILISSDSKAIVHKCSRPAHGNGAPAGANQQKKLAFAWVVDFPLFEEGMEEGHYAPSHHMFTAPEAGAHSAAGQRSQARYSASSMTWCATALR